MQGRYVHSFKIKLFSLKNFKLEMLCSTQLIYLFVFNGKNLKYFMYVCNDRKFSSMVLHNVK